MIYSLSNINNYQTELSIIKKSRVIGTNNKTTYNLLEAISVELSNGDIINIPAGFRWDGSSTPRLFWNIVPPEGDFELGALIHDYLYENKKNFSYSRKFVDKEMLLWSKQVSGTNKTSIRNIDNYIRYYAVRIFGGLVWKDIIKIK